MLVANTWPTPVSLQAEYNGKMLDIAGLARTPVGSGKNLSYQPLPNGQLEPGQVGILFLSRKSKGLPCPPGVTPGFNDYPSKPMTGFVPAFHVTTSAPVVAFDIFPYGGVKSLVSSATLLLPTPTWGTSYVASDAYEMDPLVQIVASQENTKITIKPTVPIEGGVGVQASGQGQPVSYTLNKGQMLQFLQSKELAGSLISSDKPVGVWGGSRCTYIPIEKPACDAAHQQLPPLKALGSEYAAVRYRDRAPGVNQEAVLWTIIGAVDGTTLTYDPAPPPGAPTTLASGQMVRFFTTDLFVVKSQDDAHPFLFAGHMTGCRNLADNVNDGDPEYVIVIPPRQYLSHYLFLTDPTFKNTHLVFVRQKAKDGTFKPVKLACTGEIGGFQPLGASGQYEYARFDLVVGGSPQGACDNGVHTADSEAPFGLTVWGWDFQNSYAYPAGMSAKRINIVKVPPIPK